MAERKEIELIPKEVEAAREQKRKLRTARLIGFGVLGFAVLALVLLLSLIGGQALIVNNLRRQVSEEEARIAELASVEEKVLGLEGKNTALTQIFSRRSHYSILLRALQKSVPRGITIASLSAAQGKTVVDLSGTTKSYGDLAIFLRNLVDSKKGGSLFTEAALTSVALDPTLGVAKFIIVVAMQGNGLKR